MFGGGKATMRQAFWGLILGIAGMLALGAQQANASVVDPFADLNSSATGYSPAGPSNYGILELGGTSGTRNLNLSAVTVNGNVGVGSGGTVTNQAPSKIVGNLFESTGGSQYSGPGSLTGTKTVNSTLLSGNVAAAMQAATDAKNDGSTPTQTFGAITTATTITGVAGLNIINISSISLNNKNLTLSGPSTAKFIINVAGNVSLVGTASLLTSGSVSNSNVLYNFTGSTASLQTNVGDVVDGIFLQSLVGQSMNLDGTFNGELIGTNIALLSNATVNQPPPAKVPEPTSLALLAGALAGFSALRSRKSRHSA